MRADRRAAPSRTGSQRSATIKGTTPAETRTTARRTATLGAASDDQGERPTVPVFDGGSGAHPGIDLTSNRALHEVLDDGVDLDLRR